MAITGPSSYVPTMNEFIAHWELVDEQLGVGNELSLAGGTTLATLITLRTDLITKRAALEGFLNDVQIASAQIKLYKAQLLERFQQFTGQVRALFPGRPYELSLPDQPGPGDAEGRFFRPMNDIYTLWDTIISAGTAITLAGGYDDGDFSEALDILRTEFLTYDRAEAKARLCRNQRNALQDQIQPILKGYRQMVPAKLGEADPLSQSLPRLSPKPGATPEPVNASALWLEAEAQAQITWEASDNPHLDHYELRYTPGPDYDADDEAVVAHISPAGPLSYLTDAGLTQPGAQSTYKVYVILSTGNERGSTAMTVERPG